MLAPARKLTELYPTAGGDDSAWVMLARASRATQDTNAERAALEKMAALDADALEAFLRLGELGTVAGDEKLVYENARRALAVNPLIAQPHRLLAESAEALRHPGEAIRANRTLLLLDPPDPAQTYYRLARLLQQQKDPEARRRVLQALEEAPRFRGAHQLLREIQRGETSPAAAAPGPRGAKQF